MNDKNKLRAFEILAIYDALACKILTLKESINLAKACGKIEDVSWLKNDIEILRTIQSKLKEF